MGQRSNTLPQSHSKQKSSSKKLGRSATATQVPETKSHHIHLPHPHIPFRHGHSNEQHAELPSTRPSNSSAFGPEQVRPGQLNRQNSVQTRYMNMLLSLDTIPRLHNILASFFTWLLLAGFLVFPGTFTSIASLGDDSKIHNQTAADILRSVKHVQLLVVAGVCSGIGVGGMLWLWWRWRQNFVWLLNKIFLPGSLNSFAGLISTLINVYSQQGGTWSITAKVTAIVTGACMVIMGVLFVIYNFIVLGNVKKSHVREMDSNHIDEGIVEKMERKANEPALEPGSVV